LGPGPFRDAMERDQSYLLRLDPDRLLHTFRLNVGLASTALPYGGWEAPKVELRGHTLGHYLTACALMYRSTGEAEWKRRIDYIVGELARCQAASPGAGYHEGYLSAYPESFIDRVEKGQPVWAPWYTLHKIYAGLLDAYRLAGNRQALGVLTGAADWIAFRVERLTPEQMEASLQMEFGGMNDVLASLYATTGDARHLALARAFDHDAVFDPWARGEDTLDGLHANTQIPKAIGAAREYEVTGESRYRDIARFFWDRVALHRSYAIGGHSDREAFFPVTEFRRHRSAETAETCNTHNMLKLTRRLFAWEPSARGMDFYERGLYNHILASQEPGRGMFVYLMALEAGRFKTYSTAENSFWCCVGTGMENHAQYGEAIFAHGADDLFVNLLIGAEVEWRAKGVTLRQDTAFPDEDGTRLTWQAREPIALTLRVRHPAWARGPLAVAINGTPVEVASKQGSYAAIARTWRTGDVVDVRFPMELHVETLPGAPDQVALLYGPIVLAGRLGGDGVPSPYAEEQTAHVRFPPPDVPHFVTSDADWRSRVQLVSRRPLLFRTRGLAQPGDVVLEPFFRVHHERYAVYWTVLSPERWSERQAAIADVMRRVEALPSASLDHVIAGDVTSESAHAVQAANSQTGKVAGRTWRHARNPGAFSYRLGTKGARPEEAL
ncbi:MAG TPA: beta-L-arabinofuranosidase domain-containing protein, partial [Vicinamibacteria bacterium]